MTSQGHHIPRTLTWIDQNDKKHAIKEDDLLTRFNCPLIILGEPGMGKTWLMKKLGKSGNCQAYNAPHFLRQPVGSIPQASRLIIDGLDEVAAREAGDPLHNVLKKLISHGKPLFIISCRSTEWHGATARLDIENDYDYAPKVLTLSPLSENGAVKILARAVGTPQAKESIINLSARGLEPFFQNPLNLEFVTTILKKQGHLPETRAELLEHAVAELYQENNPVHANNHLGNLSKEEALDAAGCIMATMLIAGKESISKTPAGALQFNLPDISELINSTTAQAVLGSRLFRLSDDSINSEETSFFIPLHRTVAEFLGARWLAQEVEKKGNPNRVARRLLGLISAEGGVPASLRGLHAWLPKFSRERLGPNVIDRDPYGVLRYGDGDHLSKKQVRQIIQGLRQLANFDPYFSYFSYDSWDTLSIKGLAHSGLTNDIRKTICNTDEPWPLRSMLLEAIKGTGIVATLMSDLQNIMLDPKRDFDERKKVGIVVCGHPLDWPAILNRLSILHDDESTRLVVELIPEIGIEQFSAKQIANAVMVYADISNKKSSDSILYSYHSLVWLERSIPNTCIKALLNQLTDALQPFRDPEKNREIEHDERYEIASRFAEKLIARLLRDDPISVKPDQLWKWMRILWSQRDHDTRSRRAVCKIIEQDDQLRLEIQRLALFAPDHKEAFHTHYYMMRNLCRNFRISNKDARIHLSELVDRNDPAERIRWMVLVEQFRNQDDQLIPNDIQKIARPYTVGNQDLKRFLTKKPKRRILSESEKKWKRRIRDQERRKKRNTEKIREQYTTHINEVRRGELGWILYPAQAYLGMFGNIPSERKPPEKISEWLGDDLRDASLIGFEAVLNRSDLPSAKQITEEYAKSRTWNFTFPMLAAAGQRYLAGEGFGNLSHDLVSSLAIIAEHELLTSGGYFGGLKEELNTQLRASSEIYEAHLRTMFEPLLESKMSPIPELYRLVREEVERPLSTRLCLEWLKRYPELPLTVANELIDCIIRAPKAERPNTWQELASIAKTRLNEVSENSHQTDVGKVWRSVQFLTDFEIAVQHIPDITKENRDWLWSLTGSFYYNGYLQNSQRVPVTIAQLKWLVITFRYIWPNVPRPRGIMIGTTNPWDATELLKWSISQIAREPSEEAVSALTQLRDMSQDDYTNDILSAIAQNHRVRIEAKFRSPTLVQLKAVLTDQSPESAADIQSIVLEEFSELQNRLRGDPLNPVNNFYDDNGTPRTENECRDQMLIAMGHHLPYGIKSSTEVKMPQEKRSDVAFSFGDMEVPLEAKGQWHKDVWTGATDQLARYYCVTHRSASKGIYVVFWFGENVPPGKRLRRPPNNGPRPKSPEDMQIALQSIIPSDRRSDIAIVVLDVTKL